MPPPGVNRARFDPLDAVADVLRVGIVGKEYLPDDAVLPTDAFFAPTSEDKKEAAERGQRVMLSCYDRGLTTLAEARAIRLRDLAEDTPTRAFALRVAEIRQVGQAEGIPLDVVDDGHDPEVEGPGAEGHCGIVGLDREEKKGTKNHYRSVRLTLARGCREVR